LYHEEQFGPAVPVVPFDDPETPVQWVIESPYGQQVSLFGADPARLALLIDALANQVGRINLNCKCQRGPDIYPFTGRKDSAEGVLSVPDGLLAFSVPSVVSARTNPPGDDMLETVRRKGRSNRLQ
ncbi:MAG: aldehyde dehydrogenase family protein, partial [Proteobacteria bacterium]|nr:aldehyde dehydrogenase family protein [Pseudomonadota bacterium]